MAQTCAIVVNWNGWRDTVVCVESLMRHAGAPLHILVCDNGSGDGSPAEMEDWLRRRLPRWHEAPGNGAIVFVNPDREGEVQAVGVLRLPRNFGYAGGANAGIRWAQAHWPCPDFWVLNNDIRAEPGALRALVDVHARLPDAGVCGSVLLDWDSGQVQALGARYRHCLAVGTHLTQLPPEGGDVFLDIDYPVGASLYVTGDYLDRVGLLEEGYFLYYEEMDWVERGRRAGYRPVVALRSRLHHREGASTGSRGARQKSMLAERLGILNRLRVTRKFWPHLLPVVWLSLWVVAAERAAHREFARAALVLQLMFRPKLWL